MSEKNAVMIMLKIWTPLSDARLLSEIGRLVVALHNPKRSIGIYVGNCLQNARWDADPRQDFVELLVIYLIESFSQSRRINDKFVPCRSAVSISLRAMKIA